MDFRNNRRNLLVQKFGAQWKYEIHVTVQTEVSIIIMYLFDYVCVYYLLVLTNAHIILKYILYKIFFPPTYLFRLATILRKLPTKWLKTHSNKLVLTMLCTCTYIIARTNLLLWVLNYLVDSSMRMAIRKKHEWDW